MQNPIFRNVYGVGVTVHLPAVEQTPIPTGVPITGQMSEGMAAAVAHNIVNEIKGKSIRYTPTLAAVCIGDMDTKAVGYVVNPVLPPRKKVKISESWLVHLSKLVFERHFLWKVKRRNIYPWFENLGLRLMFGLKPTQKCTDCKGALGTKCS